MTRARWQISISALATVLVAPTAAMAQGTSPQDAAQADTPSGGEIVVTAQKRPELLSKAPLAISAVSGSDLRSGGVTDALALQTAVPTVKIDQSSGLQVTIRGVSSADGTEKGDPSAAFMLNGIYLARPQQLSGAFYDVERVEVLRGPQGTLYGRNATAGVINVLTKRPTDTFSAAANGEYGNYGTYRLDAMVNVPVTDRFAIRAAGAYNKHDSYLIAGDGVDKPVGQDQDEIAGRLSADLKFGASDQGNLLIVADYSHQGGYGPQAVTIGNFFSDATTTDPVYLNPSSRAARTVDYSVNSTPSRDTTTYGVTAELGWDFGPVNLTYLGSYRVFDQNNVGTYVNYNRGRYADIFTTGTFKANSQELRLATSGDGPLTAVAGLYYFREKGTDINTVLHGYAGYALYAFLQNPVIGESKAAFGQATYKVTDRLRLTGGLRYSRDEKSREGLVVLSQDSEALDPDSYTVSSVNDAHRVDSKLTWKVGAEYDLAQDVLFYSTVSTGYKAGGFNDGCTSASSACTSPITSDNLYYKPEQITAYEAGLKGKFLNNAVNLSLTGFAYDYTDMQLSSPGTLGQTTLNAGKAKVYGFESQAIISPVSTIRLDFSINYLDAHYTDYEPLDGVDFAGKQLDNAPEWIAQVGYTHTLPLANGADIVANVNSQLSDSYVITNFANATQFRMPSYTKSNASVTYNAPGGAWYLQAFVKNIENTITFSGYGLGRVYTSEPRRYGVRAGVKF